VNVEWEGIIEDTVQACTKKVTHSDAGNFIMP